MPEEEKLYTTGEVAKTIGVSLTTVDTYIYKGWLVPDKILPSKRRLFKKETIDNFNKSINKKEIE